MNSTIAALSSANGEAAVSIVRISGRNCRDALKRALALDCPAPRKMTRAKYRASNGDVIDDVLAVFFAAPASYTGEDSAEIYCHGSPFIVQKILEDLFANECSPAHAGEFTRRAFLNDKMDLSQAEAVALTIGARSQRSLQAAQRQLDGGLGKLINNFSSRLVDICALAEAYIDFPEDDLPDEDVSKLLDACAQLAAETRRLAATSKYSALIHQGINTVIAGAPNAGKSSLLNAMMGTQRAIVSPLAGTTRDFISEKIIVGAYSLNIIDTAGLRNAENQIEETGVEMAKQKIDSADIRLLTIDASSSGKDAEIPDDVLAQSTPQNTIIVLNKCDLAGFDSKKFEEKFPDFIRVKISCLTNDGLDELKNALVELIQTCHVRASADDILVSARHANSLERSAKSLDEAAEKIASSAPAELYASDLRNALDELGEIVGKTDNEAILDKIFSSFCIGK